MSRDKVSKLNNTLASYAVGFLVVLVVLMIVMLVGGAFASAIMGGAGATATQETQVTYDGTDNTIELQDDLSEVNYVQAGGSAVNYTADTDANTITFDDSEVGSGQTVMVSYVHYAEEGDKSITEEQWSHESGQTEYALYENVTSAGDVYGVIDQSSQQPVSEYSVDTENNTVTYNASAVEPGTELSVKYEYPVEGGNEYSGDVQTIVGNAGTALVIFGVSVLVLPAVAVIVLIVSGLGGLGSFGRNGGR